VWVGLFAGDAGWTLNLSSSGGNFLSLKHVTRKRKIASLSVLQNVRYHLVARSIRENFLTLPK
jgi:hypothetical protein